MVLLKKGEQENRPQATLTVWKDEWRFAISE